MSGNGHEEAPPPSLLLLLVFLTDIIQLIVLLGCTLKLSAASFMLE